jgi:secretion/DNA translocation related TadE-like protein
MSPGLSPSRRRLRSLPWSWCSSCACPGSRRSRCRCAVSMPRGRRRGLPPAATVRRQMRRGASHPTALPCNSVTTGDSSSPPSPPDRRCCLALPSPRRRWPRLSPVCADRGSASLVAVAMMAVLLAFTVGGVYVGSAVIARHRAQAAADLAALAAAGRLAEGADAACAQASVVAQAMRTAVTQCVVEDLDVVVTVEAPVALGVWGPARAAARAGPSA